MTEFKITRQPSIWRGALWRGRGFTICDTGLNHWFEIPNHVKTAYLVLSAKPSQWNRKITLKNNFGPDYAEVYIQKGFKRETIMLNDSTAKKISKFMGPRDYCYVHVEYNQ